MESLRPTPHGQRPAPRLYLVTPPLDDAAAFAAALEPALQAADVAAVLVRLAVGDERSLINRVRTVARVVQKHEVALLIDGHADLVARSGADGAHFTGISALQQAIGGLQPTRIAGVAALKTRHDAMLAGEAGADYVMFGEPEHDGHRPAFTAVIERVAWWAEVFQPPCVGYAEAIEEVAPLAEAGADFVALGDWVWGAAAGPVSAVAAAGMRLTLPERTA
jgi:thiamine-phosphate pyrophosphorylase